MRCSLGSRRLVVAGRDPTTVSRLLGRWCILLYEGCATVVSLLCSSCLSFNIDVESIMRQLLTRFNILFAYSSRESMNHLHNDKVHYDYTSVRESNRTCVAVRSCGPFNPLPSVFLLTMSPDRLEFPMSKGLSIFAYGAIEYTGHITVSSRQLHNPGITCKLP